ncbi:MAG: hypothetical protein M1818_005932 [Claussenomyces sp. TS43310]|nr:MAG: hypothetical protein M1818_005932 [Claussenomyces sp. TS43310]
MPHKVVATFLRAHSGSFDSHRPDRKKLRESSPGTQQRERAALEAGAPPPSPLFHSIYDTKSSMPDARKIGFHLGPSPRTSIKSIQQYPAAGLSAKIESPPLVFYGQAVNSTGALLSGQLKLRVAEEVVLKSFKMKLVLSVRMRKPFHAHCPECALQQTELMMWDFLQESRKFEKGEHDIPFSFLLPGHLPATMHGALSVIDYVLNAIATPESNAAPITLQQELNVKRSIPPSELPRQSIRIFPPTNLTAHVELPSVIHPIGEFNVSFRIDGIIKRDPDQKTQTQWRLKRLTWRLDETQKVIAPACRKHAAKAGAATDEKKGVAHSEVRTLNMEELKSGWKCDYSAQGSGSIDMEFPFSIRANSNPVCDMKAEDGTEVSHSLVVEMIVAEEIAPLKRPSNVTPTGAARVLRMHFNTIVTERGGMGISWDEEQPPLYDDVPASPPGYENAEEVDTRTIPDYEELDHMTD